MKEIIEEIIIPNCDIDFSTPKLSYNGFKVKRDEFPSIILGENGSGKTSLLFSFIQAIPKFISANVVSLDLNLKTNSRSYNLPSSREIFRLFPQSWNLGLLGFEPTDEINITPSKNSDWKKHLIETLEIGEFNSISSAHLSDGQKQRLLLCITLISNPLLILSDEWTNHLDQHWIKKISKVFEDYMTNGGLHLPFLSNNIYQKNTNIIKLSTQKTPIITSKKINGKFSNEAFLNVIESLTVDKTISLNFTISDSRIVGKNILVQAKNDDIVSISGPNGSGKTTILKLLWKKNNGFFQVFTKPFQKENNKFDALFLPTDPTYHILGPTIKDEIERIVPLKFSKNLLLFFTQKFQTKNDTDVLTLSFGQRKLFSILLALISNFDVILIDEPFAGLDKENKKFIEQIIKTSSNKGKIIFLTGQKEIKYATRKIKLS